MDNELIIDQNKRMKEALSNMLNYREILGLGTKVNAITNWEYKQFVKAELEKVKDIVVHTSVLV